MILLKISDSIKNMDNTQNYSIMPQVKQEAESSEAKRPFLPFDKENIYNLLRDSKINEHEDRISKLEGKEGQEIFPIEFLESEKLALKQPITVRALYSEEAVTWVVDHIELNVYGEGRDIDEAVGDFKIALEETYFNLKEDKDKLGPFLQKQWNLFEKIVKEK